jgi:hypothetical protein
MIEKPAETPSIANSIVDESSRRKRPLLIIDVDTGENAKDRIEVYKDDQPAELAARFCEKHDYDQATFENLQRMIEERLRKVLARMEAKRREKKKQIKEHMMRSHSGSNRNE